MKAIGADAAFNYKTTTTAEVLKREGPIDVHWDNLAARDWNQLLIRQNLVHVTSHQQPGDMTGADLKFRLEEEVASLEKAQKAHPTPAVKKKLSKARAQLTRNKKKIVEIIKRSKIEGANKALAEEIDVESLKRALPGASKENEQPREKKKVRYGDEEDRSSSLTPVPEDIEMESVEEIHGVAAATSPSNHDAVHENMGDNEKNKDRTGSIESPDKELNAVVNPKDIEDEAVQLGNQTPEDIVENLHRNEVTMQPQDFRTDTKDTSAANTKAKATTQGDSKTTAVSKNSTKGKGKRALNVDTSILSKSYDKLDNDEREQFAGKNFHYFFQNHYLT
ncbi:hypothetical protein H0H92_015289 [Tricholoma furcatifolium]|nr:hypothetical protein H0H92_015289 [Tricholoma furcatifolium]